MPTKIRALTRALVFPRRCPVCDQPVHPFGALCCPECRGRFRRVQEPTCCRCGKPLGAQEQEYCYDCRHKPHFYDRGCAVYLYHDVSGAIYKFKFEGRAEYADFFGQQMAARIRECYDLRGIDLLIPVPASAKRVRERGYNQAELLSRVITSCIGIPTRSDILRRCTNTPFLKGMDDAARRSTLKRAFHVYGNDVKFTSIMLIDDIYTTGSTIDACASQLLQAGARRVTFCTLAIGEGKNE